MAQRSQAQALLRPVEAGADRPRRQWSPGGTWTRDRVVAALRDWTNSFGDAPRSYEWAPATARHRGRGRHSARRWATDYPRWPSTSTVCLLFGTWNAALGAAGVPVHRRVRGARGRAERVADAKRLAALGLPAGHIAELIGVAPQTVRSYLRATSCASCEEPVIGDGRLCAACTTREHRRPSWTQGQVLGALRAWESEVGEAPRPRDWTPMEEGVSKWGSEFPRWPSYTIVCGVFGSWTAALRAAGFAPRRQAWDRDAILLALQRWEAAHGRPPTAAELEQPGSGLPRKTSLSRHFGSYRAGLAAAGIRCRSSWSDDAMLQALARFRAHHGRFPRTREWARAEAGHPQEATVRVRFGSWQRALTLAAVGTDQSG